MTKEEHALLLATARGVVALMKIRTEGSGYAGWLMDLQKAIDAQAHVDYIATQHEE